MSKKSDDSIERIFRQALTQYDTKFHEEDWVKMEKMLNVAAERKAALRSKIRKGTIYTLTGLTGLIIAVYFLAIKNPSGSIGKLSDSVTEMQAPEDLRENGNVKHENSSEGLLSQNSSDESVADSDERSTEEEVKNLDKSSQDPKEQSQVEASGKKTPASQQKPGTTKKETKPLTFTDGEIETAEDNGRQDKSIVKDDPSGTDLTNDRTKESTPSLTIPEVTENVEANDRLNGDVAGAKRTTVTSGKSGEGALNEGESTQESDVAEANSLQQNERATKGLSESTDSIPAENEVVSLSRRDSALTAGPTAPDSKKLNVPSRWSVALVIAPEFSTTSLSRYSSPGEAYGLRIGYQVSRRFSLNVGVVRSRKKYEDAGSSYKPRNPAYWQIRTNGVVPEEIYSRCLIYELPIEVQFDAIQTPKSRLFISTAVSSYVMSSQRYDYTFTSPNPGADMSWRSPGAESYWFSVGAISAGYERYVNRSIAIGLEPYLKFSLAEIGWPNIKLFSTGAYVTLRYRFASRTDF